MVAGAQSRSFLHINDFAEAVRFILEKFNPPFSNILLISTKNSVPNLNICIGKKFNLMSLSKLIA